MGMTTYGDSNNPLTKATLDPSFEMDYLEKYTNNVQAACDRHAYMEALDQLMEAHKHLVRLNDAGTLEDDMDRRRRKANDEFFMARCRVAAKLGRVA